MVAAALLLQTAALAQPNITSINNSELPRSGRIVIHGTGFGPSGTVNVADSTAWQTTWTDTRIVAYVPEESPLSQTGLHVVAQGQQSNEVPLAVTMRQSNGRFKWAFEADSNNLWYRPAQGPDGTLYLHTNNETDGIVYALSPDGGLLWVQTVNWYPYAPPMTGPDGAVYVSSIATVHKISPDGQIDWAFNDPGAQGVQVAPTIGPDGDLYGVFDAGMGAFALDPASAALDWSNTGDPPMLDHGNPFGVEMKFGPSRPGGPIDQMYVQMDFHRLLWAFSLDGQQRFTARVSGSISHEPAIGSDGAIYTPHFGAARGWGIKAIEPEDGQTRWVYSPENGNGISELAIGPDDTLYFNTPGRLEAVNTNSNSQRWINRHLQFMGWPSLSPDGNTLLVDGVPTFGQPGFIKAFNAATGNELWSIDLPGAPYPEFRVLGTHHARFTPNGSTAYLSTFSVSDNSNPPDPRSYLYAIDMTDGSCPADFNNDGIVNTLDFLDFLNAYNASDPAADFNSDGTVNTLDFLMFLNAFNLGCG